MTYWYVFEIESDSYQVNGADAEFVLASDQNTYEGPASACFGPSEFDDHWLVGVNASNLGDFSLSANQASVALDSPVYYGHTCYVALSGDGHTVEVTPEGAGSPLTYPSTPAEFDDTGFTYVRHPTSVQLPSPGNTSYGWLLLGDRSDPHSLDDYEWDGGYKFPLAAAGAAPLDSKVVAAEVVQRHRRTPAERGAPLGTLVRIDGREVELRLSSHRDCQLVGASDDATDAHRAWMRWPGAQPSYRLRLTRAFARRHGF